ncbi:hypothetical protein PsYK624_130720 [Phanerochaete sordida]|uniref:Uncharacterized protein n=1 Tax=Phanerochaete sordida TaxID=48140 RepID=A0A9P3LIZ5_9APHY|nr:hypothetical protein PsYK624_130720 [Phanerochaete sordida]
MPQILAALPKLRSLDLDTVLAAPAKLPTDPRVHTQNQRSALDSVHLACRLPDLPALLAPFRHITSLTLTCYGASAPITSSPRPLDPFFTASSITLHTSDGAVLSVLHGILDVTKLALSAAPTTALRELAYHRADASVPPFAPRLQSVALGGHTLTLEGAGVNDPGGPREGAVESDGDAHAQGGLGYSEWPAILRDLRLLVCTATHYISITLIVCEAHTVEDARALQRAFAALVWDEVAGVLVAAEGLERVRLGVAYGGFADGEGRVGVLREVLGEVAGRGCGEGVCRDWL